MLGVAAATRYPDGSAVQIRLGVHSGPINTGLVGSKAVKFTLMGETVDIARQLAATGCPMAVHVSEAAHERLQAGPARGGVCIPWTLQRLGYAAAGPPGGAPAAQQEGAPEGAANGDTSAAAQGHAEQTYLLPTRYAAPIAPPLLQRPQPRPAAGPGAKDAPLVSVALDTPEVSDRAGPSAAGAGVAGAAAAAASAAAAAAAARTSIGGAPWGSSAGRLRQGGATPEVQWLQVRRWRRRARETACSRYSSQDVCLGCALLIMHAKHPALPPCTLAPQLQELAPSPEHVASGPPSSVMGPASDVTALASELAAVRTTQLEAQVSRWGLGWWQRPRGRIAGLDTAAPRRASLRLAPVRASPIPPASTPNVRAPPRSRRCPARATPRWRASASCRSGC
jgi:hypothetical protein